MGEGWSLRNCVSRGFGGEATHTREMSACARLTKSGNEGYSKENRQNTKSGTSIVVYNLRDLKVFCNIGILRKSIMNYHFTVCFFSFEYLLKRSDSTLSDFV